MILFKVFCEWKQSSKGVPVSRLVNVSALSSSVLGFLDEEFRWVTGPYLEKKKKKNQISLSKKFFRGIS